MSLRFVEVSNCLRSDILSRKIPGGARLKIAELAERYNTSHMPVREALRQLSGEGLLLVEPHKGVKVRNIDRAFVENLFDIRTAIEVIQARRAAVRASPADIEMLLQARKEMEDAADCGETSTIMRLNQAFHDAIGRTAENPEAVKIHKQNQLLIPSLWEQIGFDHSRLSAILDDHFHIFEAISDKDPEASAVIAHSHCLKAKQVALKAFENEVL